MEQSLDKVLRLASASQLEPSALGKVDKSDDGMDDAHEFLMQNFSWYAAVCAGEGAANPGDHCGPKHSEGGALVKLTPRTPEASTKVQPTVPPGGPGLFHVKGLHLPPYIEHLYPHLVKRYGKHEAYRVAVGVVKKWAKGVNPGGWKTKSGKGKRTHPDVKAAAAKNVAEWEKDKEEGRTHGGKKVKAASQQPGAKLLPIPSAPKKTAPMLTAHRVNDMNTELAHAHERMSAARKMKDAALRKYEVLHICNHLNSTLNHGHLLADNLRLHYPAERRELDAVVKTLGLTPPPSLSPALKAATTSHLLETVLNECTHAIRHADLMHKIEPVNEWEFNADHCEKHLKSALHHAGKIRNHILINYPAEGELLRELEELTTGEEITIQAAAPAGWPSGKGYAKSFLTEQKEVISAPGAGTFAYGLKQEPSQTVSPSPPLPPKVDLPTPKELRAFAAEIAKMTDDNDHHLVAAQMHLESAAEKMSNNPISALHSLRSCQMAVQQAWRWRVQHAMPRIAYVFSANTPPAEQSSQQQMWAKEQDRIGEMKGAASKVAVFIDRVRRAYFGRMGMENQTAGGGLMGQPNARL